jgi:hypothetical protein
MRVEEAKFGFDKEGNPCLIAKCRVDVDETSGKFKCGFGLLRGNGNELFLFAFRDNPDNPIAIVKNKEEAIRWLKATLDKNGYKWYHLYVSGVEQVDGWYAFMVPFNAEGWAQLSESVRKTLQDMLKMLEDA